MIDIMNARACEYIDSVSNLRVIYAVWGAIPVELPHQYCLPPDIG